MKYLLLLLVSLVFIVVACEKNKFTTVPQLEAKSISPEQVFQGDIIRFVSEFTDKEGDLDSALITYKWFNGTAWFVIDTFRYNMEDLDLPTKITDGEAIIRFEYGSINTGLPQIPSVQIRDTTAAFGLIIIDKANQRSNYVESKPIRLIKP